VSEILACFTSVDERAEETGTNYRGLALRKGARGPAMLRMFLSVSVVSLSVGCAN
jgi:hypothetical protein